jgi:hypothetical protein
MNKWKISVETLSKFKFFVERSGSKRKAVDNISNHAKKPFLK